jgi:hypothetical protein
MFDSACSPVRVPVMLFDALGTLHRRVRTRTGAATQVGVRARIRDAAVLCDRACQSQAREQKTAAREKRRHRKLQRE